MTVIQLSSPRSLTLCCVVGVLSCFLYTNDGTNRHDMGNAGQICGELWLYATLRDSHSGRTFAYALSRGQPGFDPGSRRELLGVKTWLSTLEIVNLSVFRMRQ